MSEIIVAWTESDPGLVLRWRGFDERTANTTRPRPQPIAAIMGPPGKSAYQVALANGFVGTEAEWLASLQGEAGGGGGVPGSAPTFIGPDAPAYVGVHLWVQTGLAPGGAGFTLWIEDAA